MTVLHYDSTFSGLLTCIFEVYERKIRECQIVCGSGRGEALFGEDLDVIADISKATRVWKGLEQKLAVGDLHNFYSCYLSEQHGIENTMLAFTRLVFNADGGIAKNFSNPAVLEINKVARKVFREKHRMEAFVRFKRSADGIFYADVEPQYNVLPLIATHFKDRYADQYWIIRDVRRKYAIYYDKQQDIVLEVTLNEIKTASSTADTVNDAEEALYQLLWKDYFKHVDIPVRRNKKLHLQHVPVRYWKFLTEKQP